MTQGLLAGSWSQLEGVYGTLQLVCMVLSTSASSLVGSELDSEPAVCLELGTNVVQCPALNQPLVLWYITTDIS
jgi:hypothetical protein